MAGKKGVVKHPAVDVTCAHCGNVFKRQPSLVNGRARSFCNKSCYNTFARLHKDTPEERRAKARLWHKTHRRSKQVKDRLDFRAGLLKGLILYAKLFHPCVDCKKYFPYPIMEFDHTRGVKKFCVTKWSAGRPLNEILAELKKCDVVCANCHRMRTYERKQQLGPGPQRRRLK